MDNVSTVIDSKSPGSESPFDRNKSKDCCVICLENISERAITVPCNHALFDHLCIMTWLLEHDAKCPLCKAEITAIEYDFYSPTSFHTFLLPRKSPPSSSNETTSPQRFTSRWPRGPRRRPRPRSPPSSESDLALPRRQYVYSHRLYSLHVGANRISQYRNFTPSTFTASPVLQSRARKWIRRELSVFHFLNGEYQGGDGGSGRRRANNAEFLLEYIVAILKSVDIKDCNGRAGDLLSEFLGRANAELFLHELEAWLRSPYDDVQDWDRAVQYFDSEGHSERVLDRRKDGA